MYSDTAVRNQQSFACASRRMSAWQYRIEKLAKATSGSFAQMARILLCGIAIMSREVSTGGREVSRSFRCSIAAWCEVSPAPTK